MCGIVGSFKPGNEACAPEVMARMRDAMAHRGPDGAGLWSSVDRSCALGHRRLSIIDLSDAAAQPMPNAAGTVALTFNGEIYNHQQIRAELTALGKYAWRTDHSDTEVLLHAYEEWGVDCVHRFYGMFAFAVYDARDRSRPVLHLVRDRVGIKPLYVTRTKSGEWLFASEIRALLAHPDVTPEMDQTAFWHYLTFIVTPAPMTLFRGIFKLPAGHIVTIDHAGRAAARQYWDCRPDRSLTLTERDLSETDAVAELTRLLKQSIARRMVSDVPFGVLLSGGVDSSLNVALMSELMSRPVTTFTIGYEGKEDYNEFQFARRVSQRYKTDHHETLISRQEAQDFLPLLVRLQDEPIADNVCIPLYFLARLVKQSGTTVVQVGEGADENFLGYWWCEHYRQKYESVYKPALGGKRGWRGVVAALKAKAPRGSGEDYEIQRRAEAGQELFWGGAVCWWGDMRARLTPDRAPFCQPIDCPIEGLLPESHRTLESHDVVEYYEGGLTGSVAEPEILQKIPYMEMKLRLPEHLLMRVDKLTMAHAVEARVPFLDHDVVDFATRLPSAYKLAGGVGKSLLKKAAAPYLDDDLIHRKKQGFGAPMEEWFREGDFGKRCLAAFNRSTLKAEGYFDNAFFTDLLQRQMNGSGGESFRLWTVMNAVLWHESWIAGNENCFSARPQVIKLQKTVLPASNPQTRVRIVLRWILSNPGGQLGERKLWTSAVVAAALVVTAAVASRPLLRMADSARIGDLAGLQFEVAANWALCGRYGQSTSSSASSRARVNLAEIRNPQVYRDSVLDLLERGFGSRFLYCLQPAIPTELEESSMMLIDTVALRIAPRMSLRTLAIVFAVARLVLIWVFAWYLMRAGYSVLIGSMMIGLAVYLTMLQGGNLLYAEYPFILPVFLAGVGAAGFALQAPALPVAALGIGLWAGFIGNLRSSYYPAALVTGVLFLAFASRVAPRRRVAFAFVTFALGILAFERLIRQPEVLRTHHVVAHPLVLGLANPPNDLSRREGIRWDDAVGLSLAARMDPHVTYLGPSYEPALFRYYFGLWRSHPREMTRIYWDKLFLTGDSLYEFLRSTRQGLGIGLYWTEKNGVIPALAARSVESLSHWLTLGGVLLLMLAAGLLMPRWFGVAWSWPLVALGAAGVLAFGEAAIILGSVVPWYQAVLIFSIIFAGLVVFELCLALWSRRGTSYYSLSRDNHDMVR